ncbi:MAG: Outer membrane protein OprM [Chlamydiia bacterium]|nr:Outer membrane protein OprM [Chlamydiia bacterium]
MTNVWHGLRNSRLVLHKTLLFLLIPVILTGCSWLPECEFEQGQMPDQYGLYAENDVISPEMSNLDDWWHKFKDPTLEALVLRGLEQNNDIEGLQAEIIERASYYGIPEDHVIRRIELCKPFEIPRSIPDTREVGRENFSWSKQTEDINGSISIRNLFSFGLLDTDWEIDFYGRQKLFKQAACLELRSMMERLEQLMLETKVNIAKQYVTIRAMQKVIEIFDQQIQKQLEILEITKDRVQAGISSSVDANLILNTVSQTSALYSTQLITLDEAWHALAILLNEKDLPRLKKFVGDTGVIPEIPYIIDVGVPVALLNRRPNIRAAELAVKEACARVGVAWSHLFPILTVNPSMLLSNIAFNRLFNAASFLAVFKGTVLWPLFQRWKRQSDIRVHQALLSQAAIEYEKQLVIAINGVELAIQNYINSKRNEESHYLAAKSSLEAFLQSEQLYRHGMGDFLRLLDAQFGLLQGRALYVRAVVDTISAQLDIYTALGGSVDIIEGQFRYH